MRQHGSVVVTIMSSGVSEAERERVREMKARERKSEELGRARARWAKGATLDGEERDGAGEREGRVWENV